MYEYFTRIGIALSVLFNVILGGYSNQTFSARNYAWKREGKFNLVWLIDICFRYTTGEIDHCMNSWVYWYTRKNMEEKHYDNNIRERELPLVH